MSMRVNSSSTRGSRLAVALRFGTLHARAPAELVAAGALPPVLRRSIELNLGRRPEGPLYDSLGRLKAPGADTAADDAGTRPEPDAEPGGQDPAGARHAAVGDPAPPDDLLPMGPHDSGDPPARQLPTEPGAMEARNRLRLGTLYSSTSPAAQDPPLSGDGQAGPTRTGAWHA